MNISTGGPHILLFERDQQLATLLMSELQLAGYEGHTARTAVEVFDAIARYPVRLVLVNLAQAAAARREFWVALDTQRRGSNIQVLTFHCTNLAGYGARDLEEHVAHTADLEIDGMLGMVRLLDVVRARVPNVDINANTIPRMGRTGPSTSARPAHFTQPIPVPNSLANNKSTANGVSSASMGGPAPRNNRPDEGGNQSSASRVAARASLPHTPPSVAPAPSVQSTGSIPISQVHHMSQTSLGGSSVAPAPSIQSTGSIPISQVHHMSQTSLGGSSVAPAPSIQSTGSIPISQIHQTPQVSSSSLGGGTPQAAHPEKIRAVIYPSQQRSWNTPLTGQEASKPQEATAYVPYASRTSAPSASDTPVLHQLASGGTWGDSGLAQLTRMVQASQAPVHTSAVQIPPADDTYVLPTYTPPIARVGNASEAISSQPLRPAPIQDLPEQRPVTPGPLGADGQRRTEALSHASYSSLPPSAQVQPSATQSPLASIATSGGPTYSSSTTLVRKEAVVATNRPATSNDVQRDKDDLATSVQTTQVVPESVEKEPEAQPVQESAASPATVQEKQHDEVQKVDDGIYAQNSVILDILQSLPPMSSIGQQQAIQPQVLNGRATRSLGSVLLDGHLVPQDRLEVAQNIQRMLRGVDLNYQLGEILLMFKLLTPDQLLAASLVSYGVITTNQISAFGRIRQELHSIGLEYDLENLLILFRILTAEQLREARSNIQN